jgi:hypothetical protein
MQRAISIHRPWYERLLEGLAALKPSVATSALETLDAAALRDIGIDASEVDSIRAEAMGHAHLTRRRIRAGAWTA